MVLILWCIKWYKKSPFIRAFFTSKIRPFSLKILSDTHLSGEANPFRTVLCEEIREQSFQR